MIILYISSFFIPHFIIVKTTSTTNRKVSIDRSSSDKENNLSVSNISISVTNKTPSRRAMTNTGKKQDTKTSTKVCRFRELR